MEIVNKFSETFKDLRMEYTISRSDIAIILDVSEATVGFWEREGRKPSFNQLIMLSSDYYGVSVDYLIGNSDERTRFITNKHAVLNTLKNNIEEDVYVQLEKDFSKLTGTMFLWYIFLCHNKL